MYFDISVGIKKRHFDKKLLMFYSNQKEAAVSEAAMDKEAAKRLWAISERWTRLT